MTSAERLRATIAAACPVAVVRVLADGTGSFVPDPSATQAQITAGNAALAAYDYSQAAEDAFAAQRLGATAGRATGCRVAADRSATGAALVDVPDLNFQLDANKSYAFYFDGFYTAAATTTGLGLAVNGPAASFVGYGVEIATSNAGAWVSGASLAYDGGVLATSSLGTTPCPFHVYGTVTTTAAGVLTLRGRSEVAGSAVTIKRGSFGVLIPNN